MRPQVSAGEPGSSSARERFVALLNRRLVLAVIATFLLLRLVSAAMISWVATKQNPEFIYFDVSHIDYWALVQTWDGQWYRTIAEHGYPHTLPVGDDGAIQQNPWAFYPLFPYATKALMAMTGGSFGVVGSLFALACGTAAAALMVPLLRERIGVLGTFGTIAVFAASPPSPVLQMAYTESLGLLLLVGFLLCISREKWLLAAGLALACGLARPIALPLGLVALVAVIVRWRARSDRPVTRPEGVRMVIALASCGISGLMWPVIASIGTGDRSAYTHTMGAWRASGKVTSFKPWLTNFDILFGDVMGKVLLVVFIGGFVAMVLGPWARGLGFVMRTWLLGYALYLIAVLDVWTSTYRYLLFMFPLAAVLIGAGWAEPAKRRLVGRRTAAWVALGLGWQLWWIWTLLRLNHTSGNPI